jgi:hypothetical protein
MSNKFTHGPWIVEQDVIDDDYSLDYLRVVTADAEVAGQVLIEADARLIAAAPELLAALEQIERLGREADGNFVDVRAMLSEIARAAIAKATGE